MAFLIGIMAFTPLLAMENNASSLKVILNAPEYWKEEQGKWVQYDLNSKGDLCPMGPREHSLELKYVKAFPKLKAYLDENENKFRGFDPRMFNLLKNCLQFSYLHQTADNSAEQEGMEKVIEHIFVQNYGPAKLVDALYISRLAGLSLIEKLALKAFKEKKDAKGRSVRLDDVYPSFDSLDQIGPSKNMSDFAIVEGRQDQSSESESESESEESSESQSSSESESEEEINELPQFDFFFELHNFSPEALLKSLEKRFTQTKQQNPEENTKKNALVVAALPLGALKVTQKMNLEPKQLTE